MTYTPQTWVANTTVVSAARMNYIEAGLTAAAAGGGGGMTKIFDSTLGATTASIDTGAGAIAAGYSAIEILLYLRTDTAGNFGYVRVNNDTGTNYDWVQVRANGSTPSAGFLATDAGWPIIAGGTAQATGIFSTGRLTIPSYDGTVGRKAGFGLDGLVDGAGGYYYSYARQVAWRSTAAITRVAVSVQTSGNLVAGSRMTIYGLP